MTNRKQTHLAWAAQSVHTTMADFHQAQAVLNARRAAGWALKAVAL